MNEKGNIIIIEIETIHLKETPPIRHNLPSDLTVKWTFLVDI